MTHYWSCGLLRICEEQKKLNMKQAKKASILILSTAHSIKTHKMIKRNKKSLGFCITHQFCPTKDSAFFRSKSCCSLFPPQWCDSLSKLSVNLLPPKVTLYQSTSMAPLWENKEEKSQIQMIEKLFHTS